MLDRNNVDLPPELRAMNAAMDAVFGAITKPTPVPQFSTQQLAIESAILRAAPFDYLVASEIFAALQRRLELRYEDHLNTELADRMARLAKTFENITGVA